MGKQEPEKGGKQICIGMLAHVDAGKTTLSESILYRTGMIRKLGRVDHQTAFLDTDKIERSRGITVFSKEARFPLGDRQVTLLDTPGHVDFSGEMERTLQVLDYAILVISGTDGVQSHTVTLWKLLDTYGIPVFLFLNKMDQPGADPDALLSSLAENLGEGFIPFDGGLPSEDAMENLAMCSETLMEEYLASGSIEEETVKRAIADRKVFPVCFGSALKVEGVDSFLRTLERYTCVPDYPEAFGARIFKITRDKQGQRQTHMKITGGILRTKELLQGVDKNGTPWEEKADQIRLYSGTGFQMAGEAEAGMICAVTGLSHTWAGEGLGAEEAMTRVPVLEPAFSYQMILPAETDHALMMQKLRQLEEEDPLLHLVWKEALQEIHVQVMGDLELDVLRDLIRRRFDLDVSFGAGNLIYKETISGPVIGIGHFEPLRHYAEVQLLLEPGERGSGLVFDSVCSEDRLDRNWQRLILTHLAEQEHPGVLTGAAVTDLKITLLAGRAHPKHTEGGDFRQATYRAVRQGLRKAEAAGQAVLLEPVCSFRLELPEENLGRAMSDLQRMGASCCLQERSGGRPGLAFLTGEGPAGQLKEYQREVAAYTRGRGRFLSSMAGYGPCHNQEEVVRNAGYRPESDLDHPTGSVFCDHGAGIFVSWDAVDAHAHVDSGFVLDEQGHLVKRGAASGTRDGEKVTAVGNVSASEKELEEIFLRTYGKSKRDEALRRERLSGDSRRQQVPDLTALHRREDSSGESYLIIDGYNVIFAWEELKELAQVNLDSAREALLDILANYQGYRNTGILVVFDGYRVKGNPGTQMKQANLDVVYTKEAETADRFIEKTIFELGRKYKITVVTSDRPVQMAALGDGAARMSVRDFYREVTETSAEIRRKLQGQRPERNRPFEGKLQKS